MRVLFVTWDGPGSSYLESLFLPIFKMLAQRGIVFHIIQFTWASKNEINTLKNRCEEQGCSYQSVPVLRQPLSAGSLVTTFWGAWYIRRSIKNLKIDIVMPRSTLPAMSSILALKSFPSVKLLFDADGLPHDERVDFSGMSPNSLAYRLLRDFEALAVRRADAILTRSKKAIDILVARGGAGVNQGKFHVVTNGRDEKLFRPGRRQERLEMRRTLGIEDDVPLLVYVGSSMDGKYCGRAMLEFFKAVHARRKDARLLLLTSSPEEADKLLNDYEALRLSCHIKHVQPENVPKLLRACDLGLVLIHSKFSMQAVAAIKLGEYLLCGIPVLVSDVIGDSDELIADGVGYSLVTMLPDELESAADWFLKTLLPDGEGIRQRSRDVGLKKFTLETSVDVYARVIQSIRTA